MKQDQFNCDKRTGFIHMLTGSRGAIEISYYEKISSTIAQKGWHSPVISETMAVKDGFPFGG
jgi:hypothetical protein